MRATAHLLGDALVAVLIFAVGRLDDYAGWCHWIGHSPTWTGSVVACRQCGKPLSTP